MIRFAGMADVPAIRALLQSVAGFWDATWRSDVLERVISSADTITLIDEEHTAPVGFACAHDVGFRAYLSTLVVAPAAQGRGVGSRLLAAIEHRLTERGCAVVIADVWRDAEGFYRSQGWTPPAVVLLRKRLAPEG